MKINQHPGVIFVDEDKKAQDLKWGAFECKADGNKAF